MIKKVFKISGMHCSSCALLIEGELADVGVTARCSYPRNEVEVEYDAGKVKADQLKKAVAKAGYQLIF